MVRKTIIDTSGSEEKFKRKLKSKGIKHGKIFIHRKASSLRLGKYSTTTKK